MTRPGSPPKVCPELVRALAYATTEKIEAHLAGMRVTENGLATRLNAARRTIRAMEIELRRRAEGGGR